MVDDLVASVSNVIILPFTADDNSVYVVNEEMAQFPEAWAMPSNWPTNSKGRDSGQRLHRKVGSKSPLTTAAIHASHACHSGFLTHEVQRQIATPGTTILPRLSSADAGLLDAERIGRR